VLRDVILKKIRDVLKGDGIIGGRKRTDDCLIAPAIPTQTRDEFIPRLTRLQPRAPDF